MYNNSDDDDLPPPPKEVLMQTPRTSSSSRAYHQRLPKFSNSMLGFSTPKSGMPLSSKRRQPFSAMMNAFNSPSTTHRMSSTSSFPTNSNHRWGDLSFNLDNSLVAYETTSEFVPEYDFDRFTKRLQSKLAKEQKLLNDAKAKIQNYHKRENKQQSSNEICARALLLLSEIRIDTYRALITRVNIFHHMKKGPLPLSQRCRSTFTIFRMEIRLCQEYHLKNMGEDPNYVFILVGSTREKTVASRLIELEDNNFIRCQRFHVDEEMVFKNLPINFRIDLSLYVMKLEQPVRSPKAIVKKMATNFINKFSPSAANLSMSFGSRIDEDISPGFELAGTAELYRGSVGHCIINFKNTVYPLEGSGEINAKVSALPHELYAEVTGIWKLVIEDRLMNFDAKMTEGFVYLFEVQENGKNAEENIFSVDLSSICNLFIEPLSVPPPQFAYAFEFEVSSFLCNENDTGNQSYTVGFESEEELQKWVVSLNHVMTILRDSSRMNENYCMEF